MLISDWSSDLCSSDLLGRLEEIRRLLFGRAADLTDHDDTLGLGIGKEGIQAVDEVGAVHRVAADADAGRLPEARRRRLRHRLVCKRAGAGYHPDAPGRVDVPRHDADLALLGGNDARADRKGTHLNSS